MMLFQVSNAKKQLTSIVLTTLDFQQGAVGSYNF